MIKKYEGTMTSKKRIQKTFNHEKTDRVPIDYATNPGIHGRLARALGLKNDDYESVLQCLGVDFRGVNAGYTGPSLFQEKENRKIDSLWGIVSRWVENESGGYWDYCDFPLREAALEDIQNWPFPDPDQFDYDGALERCKALKEYGLFVGSAGHGDILNHNGMIRGVEQTLVDFITEEPAGLLLADRRIEVQLAVLDRMLGKCREYIDFMWLGEDLGSQHCPLISLDLFRKQIRPRHEKFIALADSYHIPVMIHCCGSSSWAFPDFIEMGIRAVDTLQPEAKDMAPGYLKENFGNQLAFHGCISTAGPLAYGTAAETEQTVKETLEIMMPGYGYFLSPTHQIQDNTPVENALAMYNAAHQYGRYSR